MDNDRRRFLTAAAYASASATVWGASPSRGQEKGGKKEEHEEEVGATEDLMREHGVLNRILLVYEEGLRRIHDKQDVGPEVFHRSATLVRIFVEDYHERTEEKFIFPEFEKAKKHVELVTVLRKQHDAGRRVTDVILRNSSGDRFRKDEARQELVRSCKAFIRMYRPHETHEDTVLFPALRKILPARRIKDLGEQFEKEEERLFGEEGFEKTVAQVAEIEKQLGIDDLAKFTPNEA